MSIEPAPSLSPPYPGADTLCESCGYALKGLRADGDCPECGLSIDASSPRHRDGPLWQTRPGAQAAIQILIALMLNPSYFFRRMRIDGTNATARLFLFLTAATIGALWWLGVAWMHGTHGAVYGLIVGSSVIALSYIEAAGVMYFSRRRDWRVPARLSERIVCYSSPAWAPAAVVMAVAVRLAANGTLDRWMSRWLAGWGPWQSLAVLVLIGGVAMLWFEVLVWVGVRQARYANQP